MQAQSPLPHPQQQGHGQFGLGAEDPIRRHLGLCAALPAGLVVAAPPFGGHEELRGAWDVQVAGAEVQADEDLGALGLAQAAEILSGHPHAQSRPFFRQPHSSLMASTGSPRQPARSSASRIRTRSNAGADHAERARKGYTLSCESPGMAASVVSPFLRASLLSRPVV